MKNSIIYVALGTVLILMIPFVAMQFTNEVNWTLSDFVVMGTLLVGTGLLVALTARKIKKPSQRVAVIAAIVVTLFLFYVHLAVGIVDSWPLAGS